MAMWSFENFEFVRDIRTKFQGRLILDLYLIIVITVLMLVLTYTPVFSDSFLRTVLGFPVTLFAPGYALTAALFPRKNEIEGIARATLSVGLSIIIVPLIGMVLNYTPWGVHMDPILACVTAFTIVCALVAMRRRFSVPEEELYYPHILSAARTVLEGDKNQVDKAFTLIILIALLISAGTCAYLVFMPRQGEQYTEFYILGPGHVTSGYPTEFVAGEEQPVIVGVANHERRNMTYDIVVRLTDNNTTSRLSAEHVELGDNQTWERLAEIRPDRTGSRMKLDFSLYSDGNMAEPYQECRLWINVTEQRANTTVKAVNSTGNSTAGA